MTINTSQVGETSHQFRIERPEVKTVSKCTNLNENQFEIHRNLLWRHKKSTSRNEPVELSKSRGVIIGCLSSQPCRMSGFRTTF